MGQTSTKLSQKVVITIPHGYCPTEWEPRVCDRTSLRAAQMLKEALTQNGIDNELIVTDSVLRSQLDFNRKKSRETLMRQHLRHILEENKGNVNLILIDIHSYPDKEHFNNAELALLTPVMKYEWCTSLFNYLLQKGVNIKIFLGTIDNDIINEAVNQFHIQKVCLVEFWEYDTSFGVQEKINLIADFVKMKFK